MAMLTLLPVLSTDKMEPEQLVKDGNQVLDVIRCYWEELLQKQFPVLPDMKTITPGYLERTLPQEAPEKGEDFAVILDDYKKLILPGLTHWQHPDFHAYYPAACSLPAILGDLLTNSIGVFVFNWLTCPTATELEVIVLNWLAKAFGLPSKFLYDPNRQDGIGGGGGTIECNASVATLTMAMALRNQAAKLQCAATTEEDLLCGRGPGAMAHRSVVYASDQLNCAVLRTFDLTMLRTQVIKSKYVNRRLIFDADDIQKAIEEDREKGYVPLMCVASFGTTNSCEFDNLQEIGLVCQKENLWLHVDAAYAGCALLCPEFRNLSKGWEFADSICFNPHKMMLVNVDCCVFWVGNHELLTSTLGMDPVYLQTVFRGMPDFKNWSINLDRNNRALKLWFTIRKFGLQEIRNLLRKHHQLALRFAQLIETDNRFEIVNDVRFGLVCFKLKTSDAANQELLNLLLKERHMYITSGSLLDETDETDGGLFLRFVCNHQAELKDIEDAVMIITKLASQVFLQKKESN